MRIDGLAESRKMPPENPKTVYCSFSRPGAHAGTHNHNADHDQGTSTTHAGTHNHNADHDQGTSTTHAELDAELDDDDNNGATDRRGWR